LVREISEANAKIQLLAPEKIAAQYFDVVSLLEEWSQLHHKATPRQLRVGEQTVSILQSPDPTKQYKEPANAPIKSFKESYAISFSFYV
jgi:hypothetical protein